MKRSFFSSSKVSYFISKAHFLKHTLLLLDLPAVKEEIIVQKQKPSTSALSDLPTASASSDLRNIIVSRKRKANDSRKVARKFYICSMPKLVLKYNYRCPERIWWRTGKLQFQKIKVRRIDWKMLLLTKCSVQMMAATCSSMPPSQLTSISDDLGMSWRLVIQKNIVIL